MQTDFTFKIGGEAGFGIMSAGVLFSKMATRSGYHTFSYVEYPSLVRGGHNVAQTTVGIEPVRSPRRTTDFLVALNRETIDLHKHELIAGSYLIYDKEKGASVAGLRRGVIALDLPIHRLAKEIGGTLLMRNTLVMGAAAALMGGELKHLLDMISESFGHKHPDIVKKNHAVCRAGYDHIIKNYPDKVRPVLKPRQTAGSRMVISANQAAALGAIAAGMQFAAIYPMTPTSNILHTLAPLQEKFGFAYVQPEDEISAINMAIGASFAGARSMVATSGGGFCLMTEGYGLAGMTETPLVMVEGMRGAPATGLPTWNEQGDLRFVLHAHQGDFPRIVLAPGDAEEAFYYTLEAFNLADKYQTPVVLLLDKHICESYLSIDPFSFDDYRVERGKYTDKPAKDYQRYAFAPDGISLRSVPGAGNHFVANSDEHDATGYSCEDAANRKKQMEKRLSKLKTCEQEDMGEPKLYGPKNADLTLVSWGSNKGAILDALKGQSNVNFLQLAWINPFPAKAVKRILDRARRVIDIECNYTAQLAGIIKEKTGIEIKEKYLKYDGRPIFPEEIIALIKKK